MKRAVELLSSTKRVLRVMGLKFEMKYNDNDIVNTMAKQVVNLFYRSNKSEIVIVNIGTDKCIPDALGPLVGTLSKELGVAMYGDLTDPIHAVNLNTKIRTILSNHPDAFIIGVDACLGESRKIGELHLRDRPIKPGAGVGKELQEVGDISIVGIVDDIDYSDLFTTRVVRLDTIYKMSSVIKTIIEEIVNNITKE